MVCIRCKMVVKDELANLGLHYVAVELGEAEVLEEFTDGQRDLFKAALLKSGLELMDDKKSVLIERIKNVIDVLSRQLKHDYSYLAYLFTEVQGTTIEKFYIAHKIERVKELLVYNELNLTEIAYLMHYSSVAHLSTQFKKVTGLTPSHFKLLREKRRSMLEDV